MPNYKKGLEENFGIDKTKEDAVKFYTLVKALFILQTELPHHYKFETQIGEKGELVFELNN